MGLTDQLNKPGDSNEIHTQLFQFSVIEMRHFDSVLPSTELTLYGETF
jgi:hypothetical protein